MSKINQHAGKLQGFPLQKGVIYFKHYNSKNHRNKSAVQTRINDELAEKVELAYGIRETYYLGTH